MCDGFEAAGASSCHKDAHDGRCSREKERDTAQQTIVEIPGEEKAAPYHGHTTGEKSPCCLKRDVEAPAEAVPTWTSLSK